MAAEAEAKKEAASTKKGLTLPVLLALIIGAVAVQVAVLFVLFRLFVVTPTTPAGSEKSQHSSATPETQAPSGVIVPVEDLVVNPRGSSSRYVLVALGLEVPTAKHAERLRQELMIPARDRIMSVVSSYSIEELQAAGARDSLRTRIREELGRVLPGVEIRNVYFSKFVIQ